MGVSDSSLMATRMLLTFLLYVTCLRCIKPEQVIPFPGRTQC